MSTIIDLISAVLVISGSIFVVIGAIGFLRMPDIYTRMHAASVIETLGAGLLIAGMLLQAPTIFVAFKLLVLAALFFFFGPVASHAIAQAALSAGVSPILTADRRERDLDGGVTDAGDGNSNEGGAGA